MACESAYSGANVNSSNLRRTGFIDVFGNDCLPAESSTSDLHCRLCTVHLQTGGVERLEFN